MQKWEYAEMIVTMTADGPDSLVLYFTPTGTKVEPIGKEENPAVWDNFNKKMARMGEEGWELAAPYTAAESQQFLYLFKRPKG
jgi:hypothetical protein